MIHDNKNYGLKPLIFLFPNPETKNKPDKNKEYLEV